ncbi:MAG TPA: folylpolyglutamate synthase/dihydrofolate synthase family protein [Candidatus Binatia bacterium]|nr:folylpolyglutamate synthase/dihydrofolate synthase family protein [Candidatus Binatia bacterium]
MTRTVGAPLTRRLDELYRFERSGMRLGLLGIERLLERGGRPDRAFPSVLIAGTNGKGSTAAHLASILRAAGLKTGLYTSPHLVRFHERIRVDGAEIGDAALEEALERWWPHFEEERPSFFEAATALAFDHFAREAVDMAVVEVGLGGRLDATNVLVPRASVITTISTDHAEILGPTLRRIAAEKAGIIKPGGTLVLGVRRAEPRSEILEAAVRQGARVLLMGRDGRYAARGLTRAGTDVWIRTPSFAGTARTPLLGFHQARNAALAALAAEVALEGRPAPVIARSILEGLAATRWPIRAEVLGEDPPVLADVAHNAEGARALVETVAALFPGRSVAVVAAFSRDKAHEAILATLARIASRFTLTEFGGERATPAATLARVVPAGHLSCEVETDPAAAVRGAVDWARAAGGVVVVTGSFYLMPEAMAALGREVPRAI